MTDSDANVKQAVPFFAVADIEASLRFYVGGLGFRMTKQWAPDGRLRWCWLELGTAALMLQEFSGEGDAARTPAGKPGAAVTICFICEDALMIHKRALARGLEASRPFVGNSMWVTSLSDPDGCRLDFESYTDAAEEAEYPG